MAINHDAVKTQFQASKKLLYILLLVIPPCRSYQKVTRYTPKSSIYLKKFYTYILLYHGHRGYQTVSKMIFDNATAQLLILCRPRYIGRYKNHKNSEDFYYVAQVGLKMSLQSPTPISSPNVTGLLDKGLC